MAIQLGDTAPDFTAETTEGQISLHEYLGAGPIETATVRTVFVIGPDKKVKLTLTYPANVGRNVDEILRVIDALQLSGAHAVSTPVNWKDGDEVIISPALSDDEVRSRFRKGFRTLKPYLRFTPQPDK